MRVRILMEIFRQYSFCSYLGIYSMIAEGSLYINLSKVFWVALYTVLVSHQEVIP